MDVRDPDAAEAGVPAPAGRSVPAGAGPAAGAPGEWPYARPRGRHEHSSARWYGRFVAVGGVVLLGASLTAAGALAGRRLAAEPPLWQAVATTAEPLSLRAAGGRAAQAPPPDRVSLAATGDVILGSAPDRLPPRDGAGFFDEVRRALSADLVMGNLDQPLTGDTGVGKCGAPHTAPAPGRATPGQAAPGCRQFRAPPHYAGHLRAAGFHLLNQANHHAHDFGAAGLRNTRRALDRHGLRYTGGADEVTVVDVHGVRVAVVGFSVYSWSNNLLRLDEATALVRRAGAQADVVVVQAHMGAEGPGRTAVRPGEERYAGENRGDPMGFSRAVIDAGADLVVGHGPHVLRGMEFYRGRLVAYSLGTFAAGGAVRNDAGPEGIGGVLRVTLRRDGSWGGGEFVSTALSAGRPRLDAAGRGADLVRALSRRDFPGTGARVDHTARISPPGRS